MNSDLYVRDVRISKEIPRNNYLSRLLVVRNLQNTGRIHFNKNVTFFVGENGIGKSTLIEGLAVAMGFNPEGGTVNFNFSTNDSHSNLHEYLTVSRGYKRHKDGFFLRAESFYNVASNIDELDAEPGFGPKIISNYGGVSLHKQSHGESFMALVENRFWGNGLYIGRTGSCFVTDASYATDGLYETVSGEEFTVYYFNSFTDIDDLSRFRSAGDNAVGNQCS